jgi:hypothetical protein
MAAAQLPNTIDNRVRKLADNVLVVDNRVAGVDELRTWLSPPDPSTNHNIACSTRPKGMATWFFEGRTYNEWKSTGSESLLWIRGKRVLLSHSAA